MSDNIGLTSGMIDSHYRKICSDKYQMDVNIEPLIKELGTLRHGGALTYNHLTMIANPGYWPFKKYWRWPQESEISKELERTNNLFKDLNENTEEKVILTLSDIFKSMQLASIILRFVYPEEYAVYSTPVAKVLNSSRGENSVLEYLNYLKAIREVRDIYALKRADYAEMFLWVLAENKNSETIRILHHLFDEENIKRMVTPDFMTRLVTEDELGKANLYFSINEFQTAAQCAGIFFTNFIKEESRKCGIEPKDALGKWKDTSRLIIELRQHPFSSISDISYELEKLNRKRNDFVKNGKKATKEDAKWMIDEAIKLKIL